MAHGLEEINRKIATQFKFLEQAEKENEQLITRNKKSKVQKYLQHAKLKLEKLQGFTYSAQELLLDEDKIKNLERWSSVMEEKMALFDDVVDRLKSAISNVEKKEEAKAKYEENIIQEEIFRRRMQEELKKIQEIRLQMKTKEYEKRDRIVNVERANVKMPNLIITKFDGASLN